MSNIEKIEVNGHYIWVDKNADISENDFILTKDNKIVEVSYILSKDLEQAGKIIAASPELKLEEVPTYVEWLARDCETSPTYAHEQGFIKGYQTAEKELYTEDDLRKAIDFIPYHLEYGNLIGRKSDKEIEDFIKELKKK